MAAPKTIFFTYALSNTPISGDTVAPFQVNVSYGHSNAIHCNYIERLETDSLAGKGINLIVPDGSLFPFLKSDVDIVIGNPLKDGSGWNARYLYGLIQIVDGTGTTVTADPSLWKILELTPQLDGYATFSATTIPPSAFNSSTIITMKTSDINTAPFYDLSYLNYPSNLPNDNNKLAFGEEAFFFGNVNTEIFATAFTTEIPALLQLNEYNSTTNETWDGTTPVVISEMGIFNANNDLVGIGKLNNPIDKDTTIYRTILFSIDF